MSKPIPDELGELRKILAKFTTRMYMEGGNNAEQITQEATAKITKLISKREIEARIDELHKLKQQDKYPFYSDEAEKYVIDRLNQLTELQEGKNNE